MIRNTLMAAINLIPFAWRGQIKDVPGIAPLQRALISYFLDGREFTHRVDAGPAKGITFPIRMPDDKGIWTGAYEIDFAAKLSAAVTHGGVAYDIGGWHGFFAGVMAAQGASEVHVFEPLPDNADRIRRLIELNPERQICLHQLAVGEFDGAMDLMVMPETSMAKLETSSFQASEASEGRLRVKVRSVDAMVGGGEIRPPSLVKIDVEGAEIMVLRGALSTIERYKPVIFAEIHSPDLLVECRELFESIGYRLQILDGHENLVGLRQVYQIKAEHVS